MKFLVVIILWALVGFQGFLIYSDPSDFVRWIMGSVTLGCALFTSILNARNP